MHDRTGQINRRDALRMALGVRAGLALRPRDLWSRETGITTRAQFALMYIGSHPAVIVAVPGTARMEYLADNIGAARGRMPDAATRRRMAALVDAA